jgi:hypothetical protein
MSDNTNTESGIIIMFEERKECTYPMSNFYTFEDEVPDGSRVSTTKDCEVCKEKCENRHCLIEDSQLK